jgi:hypothetical protein
MQSEGPSSTRIFPSSLSRRAKLVTYLVGYGVGIGVPLVLGVGFWHQDKRWLLLCLPFVAGLALAWLFHPSSLGVSQAAIHVNRPLSPKVIPLSELSSCAPLYRADWPKGGAVCLLGVAGVYGTFGFFWNRAWGRFSLYITDDSNMIELCGKGGRRTVVSPDDRQGFLRIIRAIADERRYDLRVAIA